MQQMGRHRDTVLLWRGLETQSRELLELTELAIEEGDDSFEEQLESDFAALTRELEREEVKLTLSGPYDERSAIISIHSGAGGTDSHDWAQMLLQMYSGWAEAGKRSLEVLDLSYGDEAGLRSGILEVGGDHAFGYLSAEQGVHRLVRLSPYDPNHLRHTSFANVRDTADGGERVRHRNPPRRRQDGHLPLQRPGRAERPEGGLRRPPYAHPHRHRGFLPDRTFPAPEPRIRHAHPARAPAQAAGRGACGGTGAD